MGGHRASGPSPPNPARAAARPRGVYAVRRGRGTFRRRRRPDAVRRFREAYRAAEVGPGYRGWLHFATTSVVSLAVVGFAASRVHAASALEWVTVPATFLFANFVEWAGHRGPMHHPRRPLEVLFQRHSRGHHRFFTPRR